jgi:hypothetical protein
MKSNIELDRRTVLGTVGGLAVAGSGFAALTGGATATSGNLSIGDSQVSSDNGDLSEVNVSLDHEVTWDGFDYAVDAAEYRDVIRVYDKDGNKLGAHVLRDETDTPKMLKNWSGNGDSNGWGGDGEYTSGPGTEGFVHADIHWTVLADDPASASNPVPQGQPGDVDNFGLDNNTDGSWAEYTVEFVKIVRLYAKDSNGSYTADDGTSVRLMGGDDGTVGEVKSSGTFTLKVGNEAAQTSATGSGGSNAS